MLALLGVSVLTFGLGVLAPGDPAEVVLQHLLVRQRSVEARLAALCVDQFLRRWLVEPTCAGWGGRCTATWGAPGSGASGVNEALRQRVPRTAALAAAAAALSVAIGVPAGVLAATRRNTWADHLCRLGALLGASLPSYLMAYVLISLRGGAARAARVRLRLTRPPPAALAHAGPRPAATLTRLTRSAVLEVLGEDYVRTARAKGLRPRLVLFRHALRNAMVPIRTVTGLSLGHLLGGALVVEWVFAWPGMGDLAIGAIHDRDYPLVQGLVLFTGLAYVLVNFAIDVGYALLDPRIRFGGRR